MYPSSWEASGIAYVDLVTTLIDLAVGAMRRSGAHEDHRAGQGARGRKATNQGLQRDAHLQEIGDAESRRDDRFLILSGRILPMRAPSG